MTAWRRRLRAAVALLAILLVVVVANAWAFHTRAQIDLSAADRFTLAPESRAIARAVHAHLQITAFLTESGANARDARFLLDRYREINPDIDYDIVDPDTHPGTAARLGVKGYSTVVFQYQGRRVDVPVVDEVEVSSAILRVLRGGTKTVCVLTGHGEGNLDDTTQDGYSQFGDLLRHNAYAPRTLDLTVETKPEVPDDCATVIVAGPQVPLLDKEVQALVRYAKAAGRIMLLASPLSTADPNPLLRPWGMAFVGGLAVDPDRSEGLDLSNLVVESFPTSNPVAQGVPRLQFPVSGGLVVNQNPAEGLTVSRLAVTSDKGFIETRPDTELQFDAADVPGPVVVAAAADDSRVQSSGEQRIPGVGGVKGGPRIVRTRLFATGSSVWLNNRFIGKLGNRRFAVNALNWLTQQEQILAVTQPVNSDRPLPWTPERQREVLLVTAGLVPGIVLALGLAQWLWVRRRERRVK